MIRFSESLLYLIISILLLDSLWLGVIAKNSYQKAIRRVTGMNSRANVSLRLYAIVLAYTAVIVGLQVFVLPKIRPDSTMQDSIYWGGLFGLVTYGIFNFTNLAIFPGWDLSTALIDLSWGIFLSIITTYVASTRGLGLF